MRVALSQGEICRVHLSSSLTFFRGCGLELGKGGEGLEVDDGVNIAEVSQDHEDGELAPWSAIKH